jgi:hypothetical protein
MPLVPFDTLPDSARVWIFGSTRPLHDNDAARLLGDVDRFLTHWRAHGHPLFSGRDWRHDRFLTIAVDQSTAGASGCSIDGLYRSLRALEGAFATELLGGATLFFRDASGTVQATSRADFMARAAAGEIGRETVVFDLTMETLGEWRTRFEQPVRLSWHARLLPPAAMAR